MAIKYLNNIDLRTNELQYAVIQPSINPPIDITSKLGQVYFNTTDDKLKIYTSAGWVTVGGVSSITSGDINTITIGGTIFNPTVSANTAPVTNGSLNLVTGNDVYNFVDGFGYIPYIGANQNVDLGVYSLTADSIIKVGGTSSEFLMADGSTSIAVPFNPSDYDLDEFTNLNVDPFAKISDLPTYSDFIQDSITNGVVTKAPTENAVYDALQLKQNNLGYTPVNKAGDTMLGNLILNQDPSNALQAATKQYVDNVVTGINFHPPVTVATDVSLVATYDNGLAGVGATLTGPSVGVLSIDGEFPAYLDRILVWQQTNPIENGIYDLTTVGDNVTVYQLTRSTDADNNPAGEIHYGDYVLVLSGDTNGGFGFICNTPGTIDIGITPINYVQFNAAQAVTAGYGLQEIISNIIEIDPLVTQEKITLTTIGSGAATLVSNTLNIPTIGVVSATETGVVNNTSLQELGGVDKTINGIRIGRGNISSINSANTAVGYQVLKSVINTTGLEGYYNTAVGHSALTALTTGNQNDAFGSYALYSCTTGLYNAALGTAALLSLTNGSNNVAIGASALRINLNGVRNVAIGSSALRNSTGSDNTAVGHFAGGSATSSGSSNILIGFQAGRDVSTGTNNLLIENITNASITSGSYNIVLNPKQKSGVTTGSYNTIIGCWDGAFADGLTSNVIIGDGLGQIRFQSTDTGLTTVPGQTNVLIDADTTGKAVVTKEYLSTTNYWTKTGNDIQNNNTGHVQVKLQSGKQLQTLNSAGTLVSLIDETGSARFGAIPGGALSYSYSSIGPLGGNVYLTLGRAISIGGVSTQVGTSFLLGNPSAVLFPNQQPYTVSSANYFGTSYIAGSLEPSASAGAEHSFNIGNSVGNGITSGILRISRTRVQSTVPVKYATDLSASYDDRSLVDKGYITTYTTAQLAGKMNIPSLTVSYIPKALTATTIGNSRLLDTGTYLGIDTVNTPTKDITLKSLSSREIGIENSNNLTDGQDLRITAGRTINTVPGTGFVALGQPGYLYRDVVAMNNGDMMIFVNGGAYKQINGSGNLIAFATTGVPGVPLVAISPTDNSIIYAVDINSGLAYIMKKSTDGGASYSNIPGEPARAYSDVCIMPNGDVYAVVRSSGGVWKQTGGAGNFVDMGFTSRAYQGFCPMPNGDLYITVNGGDIYKMLAGTSTLTALGQTNTSWSNGYTFAGDVYMRTGGVIYKQTSATGNFVSTGIFDQATQSSHLAVSITNNVYAPDYFDDVYVQFNNGAGIADLNGGTLKLYSGEGKGTGNSNIELYTGNKLSSGTDIQPLTLRAKINNEGLMTLPSVTNALIDGDTTGKAVVTKEYLTNVTGSQNLQQVTNLGATTTNSITANSFIKNGGSPTEYLMADGSTTNELGYTPVNKAGDTMTGSLILNANPTVAFGAATKSYVDTLINGIDWKAAANAATTTSLPTYTVSGSGQILIGTVTIPVIDGVTLTATQRLLVKNETSTLAPNNGIYVVTQVNPFILTRSSDANTPSLLAEATISVSGGSTLANTQWHCNPASVPIVIGTTNIAFAGIGANAYTFNSPLINTSNVISVLNASGTQSGVVTIGAQTFAGAKTFTDNLTAGRYLYSGGSIFPEFGQTFYINGSGAAHIFGGGTSGVQNDLQLPNGTLIVGSGVVGTPFGGFTSSSILGKSGGGVLDLRNSNSSILSGDSSGTIQFSFKGISTVGYTTATIRTIFSTAPTAGNGGNSYMVFSTNDGANGGTPAEKMRLDNNGLLLTNETASTIASFDVNKNVKSLTTANGYPTLTELKSLVGVSATTIQTQLNGKQSLATNLTSLSGLTYASPSFVKMTGVNTFTLDTSTYLTSVGIANLTATGTPSSTTYLRGDNTWATVGGTITLSAIGTVPNANGATITGSVLNLQPADAANGGVITTGVQTFGGAKTFANNITASASIIATTAPTTSLGSYNILTRNTSTGVFEKLEATNIQPLVYNILIESNSGITTQTLGINNGAEYSQDGRNVMIKNDTTAIIVTATNASDSFIASYTKLSTNNITFATSGTLIAPYGAVLYGNPGSTALLTKNGTTVYLLVNNLL